MKFLNRVLTTLVTQVIILIIGLISSVVLARNLGTEGQGLYALGIQICTWAVLVSGLGIDLGVVYYAGQGDLTLEDMASLWWFGLGWGGVITVFTFALSWTLRGSALKGMSAPMLALCVLPIAPVLMLNYQQAFLWGRNRLSVHNGINLFLSALLCVLHILLVVGLGGGVIGALAAFALAYGATVCLIFFLIRPPIVSRKAWTNLAYLSRWIRFGLRGQLSNVLQFLSYRLDLFLLNAFAETSDVGCYSIAVFLTNSIGYISGAVSFVLLPHIAAEKAEASHIFPIVCRHTLFISLLGALALGIVSSWFIHLFYGPAYGQAVQALWLLLPGAVSLSLDRPIASYQLGQGRPQIALYVTLLATPVTLGAYFLFIPRMGVIGAALGSSISYLVTTLIELFFLFRFYPIKLHKILIPERDDWQLYRAFLLSVSQSLSRRASSIRH